MNTREGLAASDEEGSTEPGVDSAAGGRIREGAKRMRDQYIPDITVANY